jgi:hypothetical protein
MTPEDLKAISDLLDKKFTKHRKEVKEDLKEHYTSKIDCITSHALLEKGFTEKLNKLNLKVAKIAWTVGPVSGILSAILIMIIKENFFK